MKKTKNNQKRGQGWSICKKCIIYSKKTENNQKKRPGCPIFKQKCQPNLEILPKRAASGERDLGVDLVLEVALKDAEVDVEIGLILNCGERVDWPENCSIAGSIRVPEWRLIYFMYPVDDTLCSSTCFMYQYVQFWYIKSLGLILYVSSRWYIMYQYVSSDARIKFVYYIDCRLNRICCDEVCLKLLD